MNLSGEMKMVVNIFTFYREGVILLPADKKVMGQGDKIKMSCMSMFWNRADPCGTFITLRRQRESSKLFAEILK